MAHVGTMLCPVPKCAGTAAVSHSATGTRNLKCPHCGFSAFAQNGTRGARLIDAATVKSDDADAQPAPPAGAKPKTLIG